MKNLLFLCLISATFIQCNSDTASSTDNSTIETSSTSIPFRLSQHNNMIFECILNEKDSLDLMLHTAANDVSLTIAALEALPAMEFVDAGEGDSWGGSGQVRVSQNHRLDIGPLHWDSLNIWRSRNSAHETDGKFHPYLFEGKILELDFDNSVMHIHDQLPEHTNEFEKLPLILENGLMFIEGMAEIGDENFKNKFLIHSGYSGALLFDDAFVAEQSFGTKLEIVKESELQDARGNVLVTKDAILPSFQIGSSKLTDLPISFFDGAIGRQKMSVLGGEILKRFNLIFDIENSNLYIKENNLKKFPGTLPKE